MQNRVRTVVMDDLGHFITTDDIKQWLNEAQRDLAARTRLLQTRAVGVVGAGSKIALPSNLLSLHWIKLDGATTEVTLSDDAGYMSAFDSGADPGFTIARIYAGNYELFPDATGHGYTIEYQYDPPELVGVNDVSPLPEHMHVKMVNYARAHATWKDHADGSGYMALYEKGLPETSIGKPRIVPVPMTLAPAMGPFDDSERGF